MYIYLFLGKKTEAVSNGTNSFNGTGPKQQYVKTVAPNHGQTSHQQHVPVMGGVQQPNSGAPIAGTSVTNQLPGVAPIHTDDKMIPIQITLPAQPTVDSATRVLTIHVPSSALNGPQLHTLLTGPVITATMGLPAQLASSLLQQHVNAALQQQAAAAATTNVGSRPLDGISDDDEDGSDDDDDDDRSDEDDDDVDEDKDEDGEDGLDDPANEEEPLNSEDDVTDEEPTDLFDTDNVVVCQYDKVYFAAFFSY